MAKVLLIYPPFKAHQVTPPLGLAYLAGYLNANGHQVRILDSNRLGYSSNDLISAAKDLKPDLIGVNIMSLFFSQAKDVISHLKRSLDVPVVIGGPHVTCLAKASLQETKADFAIVGEGEITLCELADELTRTKPNFKKINGLAYRSKNIIINPPRKLVADLDSLPLPAWKLLPPKAYPPAPHGALYKRFPIAPIITSRGCPYKCTFCSSPVLWGNKIRFRSPESVLDEIEHLVKVHGVKEIHFEDDNLTFKAEHTKAICQGIIDRGLDIAWACPNGVRIDTLNRELLRLMKRSGCYLLALGIESASQEVLDRAQKKLDISTVPDIVKMIKSEGILTWGFFIIGLPGDTRETIQKTIEFSLQVPLDRAQFSMFSPLPGTKPFQEHMEQNPDMKWDDLNYSDMAVYQIEGLELDEITSLQKEAFRRFYLRPRVFLRMVFGIKPRQIPWIIKRIRHYHFFRK